MKTKTIGLALSLAAASVLTLTGCGGSSSSTPPPAAEAYNGKFIDSAVEGVTFTCGEVSGTTATDGGFGTCPAGSTVTFSIGEMILGSSAATGDGIFFVTDIVEGASRTDTDNVDVLKIAVLLQSLDSDGDPTNGVTVAPEAAAILPSGTITDNTLEDVIQITTATVTIIVLSDPDEYSSMTVVDIEDVEANLVDSTQDIDDGTIPPPTAPTGSEGGN